MEDANHSLLHTWNTHRCNRNAVESVQKSFLIFQKCVPTFMFFAIIGSLPIVAVVEWLYRFLDEENPPQIDYLLVMVIFMTLFIGPFCVCFLVVTNAATVEAVVQLIRIGVQPAPFACFRQALHQHCTLSSYGLLIYFGCLACGIACAWLVFFLGHGILALFLLGVLFSILFLSNMTVPYAVIENVPLRTCLSRSSVVCRNNFAYILMSYGLVSLSLTPTLMLFQDPVLGPVLFLISVLLFCCLWTILSVVIFYEIRDDFSLPLHKQDPSVFLPKTHHPLKVLTTLFLGISAMTFVHMLHFYLGGQPKILYSPVRLDGVGAQMAEMLMHHAYATKQNAKFGGTCVGHDRIMINRNLETDKLIKDLGMDQEFGFHCPPGGRNDPAMIPRYLPWLYNSVRLMDAFWLDTVQLLVSVPPKQSADDIFKIVVHIRRGDVTPCFGDVVHRYLPNSFYLTLIEDAIEKYGKPSKKKVQVKIHTQSISFENLDVFKARNYTFAKLGNDCLSNVYINGSRVMCPETDKVNKDSVLDVWREFIEADVLIMSSCFRLFRQS